MAISQPVTVPALDTWIDADDMPAVHGGVPASVAAEIEAMLDGL